MPALCRLCAMMNRGSGPTMVERRANDIVRAGDRGLAKYGNDFVTFLPEFRAHARRMLPDRAGWRGIDLGHHEYILSLWTAPRPGGIPPAGLQHRVLLRD